MKKGIKPKTLEHINSKPRYGNITLTGKYEYRLMSSRVLYVEYVCDCGEISYARLNDIKSGNKTQCSIHYIKEQKGDVYGELTVNGNYKFNIDHLNKKSLMFECDCSCGSVLYYYANNLRRGGALKCNQHCVNNNIGNSFGELTVVSINNDKNTNSNMVNCVCSCGSTNICRMSHLISGQIKQCKLHKAYMSINNKYGNITVLGLSHTKKGNTYVVGECDCGVIDIFELSRLNSGNTRSCGCQLFRWDGRIRPEVEFMNIIEPLLFTRGLTLERQYKVNGYKIDGFIPELNLALEYDEKGHKSKSQKIEDSNREFDIKNEIGCDFLRFDHTITHKENEIKLFDYLNKL